MDRPLVVLLTLLAYKMLLVTIGIWASRRTRNTGDFFLAGRSLGPWTAALSASASAASAWSLLGVSGAAYLWGLSAVWILPGVLGGYLVNWYWLAPRLRQTSLAQDALTLTDVLATGRWQSPIRRLCSAIIVCSFALYIAAQLQGAGEAFASTFSLSRITSLLIGMLVILVYTLLGGFWAVSVTDSLQGLLMACCAVLLPVSALMAVGGVGDLIQGLADQDQSLITATGQTHFLLGGCFVAGLLGIGLGYPGQPHVVNRFMALRDQQALRQARVISLGWAVLVYLGMLLLGWCGRVLLPAAPAEQVLFLLTDTLFHPVVAGVILASVLSAIMSTVDSQLLVAGSALSHDLHPGARHGLQRSRLTVAGLCLVATAIALLAPEAIFTRVLFAWTALGAAFGPILLLRLAQCPVHGQATFAAIACGFSLTLLLHWLPALPGDVLERVLPFVVAFAVAWLGREKPVR